MDQNISREMPSSSFDDKDNENPKRFIEEFEEFVELKGVPDEWRSIWFKKCLGEKTLLWFEAIGKDTRSFEMLKRRFLDRFWSAEKLAGVIRKLYAPGGYTNKGAVLTISLQRKQLFG